MSYRIMAGYGGNQEEVDTAETLEEAQYLAREYNLAYGAGWTVWYEEAK
jgi:hypothetical protein